MKTDRMLSIIMILLEKKRVSARELADRFEVSLRTIYRDMDAISLAGIPVAAVSGVNGGYEIMPQYKVDSRVFTEKDLAALTTGLSGLSAAVSGEQLVHVLARLRSLIPEERAKAVEEKAAQLRFDWSAWNGNRHIEPLFNAIRTALDERRLVSFSYIRIKGQRSSRLVEPYQLILKGCNWYLYAFCREKQNYRLFRLSRMSELEIMPETYIPRAFPPAQLEYDDVLATLRTDIQLRVGAGAIDRVLDHCPIDRVRQEGESYLVDFPFIENDYYYDMLLSFGKDCECIAPPHIRRELRRRAEELAKIYAE